MYKDKIIKRINNIKWDEVGTKSWDNEGDLAYEFLRRLAKFHKDESIKAINPLISNVAELLGDTNGKVDLSKYCNEKTMNALLYDVSRSKIIEYYLQLAIYADINPKAANYMIVYEPLIKVLEKGGDYCLKINSLELRNSAYCPLSGWYERFKDKNAINIY